MRTVACNLGVNRFINNYTCHPVSSIQEIVNLGVNDPVENVPTVPSISNNASFA